MKTQVLVVLAAGMAIAVAGCAKDEPKKPEPPKVQAAAPQKAPAPAEAPKPAAALTSADFDPVYFEHNHFGIAPRYQAALAEAASKLKAHPDTRVQVAGHADAVGNARYNQALSQRRAEEVAEALERQGVSPKQLQVKGYGEKHPAAKGRGEKAYSQNRRAEIDVL